MSWVKIDDRFPEHPKIVKGGPAALVLQVRAICYCARNLTNGFLPDGAVRPLLHDLRGRGGLPAMMIDCGLWERVDGGYSVHDYLDFNPSRDEVVAARDQRSRAGIEGGRRSWRTRSERQSRTEAGRFGPADNLSEAKPNPVPDPLPQLQEQEQQIRRKRRASCVDCKSAVDHLNLKSGRHFDGSVKSLGMLHARHSKHGLDTVLAVIDAKSGEWNGTDMARHLAPDTLFNETKFDKYRANLPPSNPAAPPAGAEASRAAWLVTMRGMRERNRKAFEHALGDDPARIADVDAELDAPLVAAIRAAEDRR